MMKAKLIFFLGLYVGVSLSKCWVERQRQTQLFSFSFLLSMLNCDASGEKEKTTAHGNRPCLWRSSSTVALRIDPVLHNESQNRAFRCLVYQMTALISHCSRRETCFSIIYSYHAMLVFAFRQTIRYFSGLASELFDDRYRLLLLWVRSLSIITIILQCQTLLSLTSYARTLTHRRHLLRQELNTISILFLSTAQRNENRQRSGLTEEKRMQKTLKRLKRTCAEKHRREIRTIWPMKTRVSMFRWTAASTSSTRRTIDFDFRTPPVVWAGLVCVFLDSVAYDVYDGRKVEYFSDCSRYLNTGSKSRSERISSRMAVSTGRPDGNASSCCNDRRTTRLIDRLDCGHVASIFERCSRMSLAGKHPTRRDNYRRFQSRATIDPSISCPSEYEEYRSASVKVAESEPRKENNKDVRHRRWERSLTFFSLSVRSRILLVQYSRTRSTLVVFTQPPSVPAMDKVCSFNVSYMSITSFLLWREIVLSLRNGIMSHGHHCIADEWCLAEMPFRLENHGQCYRQNNLLDEILVSKMTSPRTPHTTVWSSEGLLSSRNDWML